MTCCFLFSDFPRHFRFTHSADDRMVIENPCTVHSTAADGLTKAYRSWEEAAMNRERGSDPAYPRVQDVIGIKLTETGNRDGDRRGPERGWVGSG